MNHHFLVTTEEVELLEAYIKLLLDILILANAGKDIDPKLKLKMKDFYAQMESMGMIK